MTEEKAEEEGEEEKAEEEGEAGVEEKEARGERDREVGRKTIRRKDSWTRQEKEWR